MQGNMKRCYACGLPTLARTCAMAADYSGHAKFFDRNGSSFYIQGHRRIFQQGISTQLTSLCQADMARALQTFLQSEHQLVGLLTGTSWDFSIISGGMSALGA